MKRASSLQRPSSHYAADSFVCGLRALGYVMTQSIGDSSGLQGDVFLTWNWRSTTARTTTRTRQRRAVQRSSSPRTGTSVAISSAIRGSRWRWTITTAPDATPRDDGRRWRSFGFELEPSRTGGEEIVILPQR